MADHPLDFEKDRSKEKNPEPLNESIGTKILSYEHRTWFQKLYQSRVTFYALSGNARAACP